MLPSYGRHLCINRVWIHLGRRRWVAHSRDHVRYVLHSHNFGIHFEGMVQKMTGNIRVSYTHPPFWDRIVEKFPEVEKGDVIFAWGTVIYRPNVCAGLSKPLMAHETVHCVRQLSYPGGVEAWWERYLAEPKFRLDEEIPAHREELRVMMQKFKGQSMRNHAISRIAARLAGPLYGNLITIAEAKKLITAPS